MRSRILITIIAAAALLQGCVYVERESDRRSPAPREPTIGEELLDLDRARSAGAITVSEYDRLKAKIIESLE